MRLHTIDTEHGTAILWYDGQPDSGWVLRYHLEPEGAEHALGRRHLDEPLGHDDPDDVAGAEAEALDFLSGQGVRAGRRLTSQQCAELAKMSPSRWRGFVAEDPTRHPDGRWGARVSWWWESRVLTILAESTRRRGRPPNRVAAEYGVHPSTVWRWRRDNLLDAARTDSEETPSA